MSKKRMSPESSADEQKDNEDSDGTVIFQQDDGVKRAKLTAQSDTTLQDLPLELIERIFVRAIVMEVKEMHLAKSVWKDKTDLVISRLSSVCPDWSNILTTNFFQNELYRTLDRTVQKTFRLEILNHPPYPERISHALIFKDELFMVRGGQDESDYAINVYDRNNLAEVKDIIPLPGIVPIGVEACYVSNCLYILNFRQYDDVFLLRITKEDEHKFSISPFISRRWKPHAFSVSGNGSLIIWKRDKSKQTTKVVVYDANGSLQHKMKLSSDLNLFHKIIPKPNGNHVLVLVFGENDKTCRTKLTEIDMNGTIQRQYQSTLTAFQAVFLADPHGRVMILGRVDYIDRIELLDNEFNLLNVIVRDQDMDRFCFFRRWHYNSERNESVAITIVYPTSHSLWSIFHLIEE